MSGAKLRSGSLSEFQPLGAEGAPVHASAEQIRAAVRRHLGPDQANLFAIPRISDRGDSIDWYAPLPGDVIPWSSATDEEREEAKTMLVEARAELHRHGEAMQRRDDRERQLFGRLLVQAMRIPDPSHVYLVEGRPVVTFWGFSAVGADPEIDVIPTLQTRMPAPVAPLPAAEPAGTRFGLPWWLLALLLLLLLGLLLFGLRGCFDSGPTVAVGPGDPAREAPETRRDDPREPDRRGNLRLGPGGVALPGGGPRPGSEGGREGEGAIPETAPPELSPGDEQAPPEIPPDEQAPPELPQDEQAPPELPPEEEQAPPELPGAPPPPRDPLEIPPEALENRSTDFLNGNWRSQTGLIDSETGRPLELEYEFRDGEGEARIRRNDGSVCRGRAGAGIRDGGLVIEGTEPIRCPDGVVYRPSTVTCSQDENGPAKCRGAYADGSGYSVGMSRQGEGPE